MLHKKFAKVPSWVLAVILVAAIALVGYNLSGTNSVSASSVLTTEQSAVQTQQDDQQGARSRDGAMNARQDKLLTRVAEILNIDTDKVKAAFEQARQEEMQAAQEKMKAAQDKLLASVAGNLGVSTESLTAASEAALKSLKEARDSAQSEQVTPPTPPAIEGNQMGNIQPPCGGPRGDFRKGAPDRSAYYNKIAESLGNGMTAEKVQAAFEQAFQALRPAAETK